MPIVHVHLLAGRTAAAKKRILDEIHAALVESFRVPDHDRHHVLHEHKAENFEAHSGPESVLVEMTVFPGRSIDAKRRLYAAIIEKLEGAGVPGDKVLVVLHEPPLENWGIRGKAAKDVNLGFKLDV